MFNYFEILGEFHNFTGRTKRSDYWLFQLMNVLITILLLIVDEMTGGFVFEDIEIPLLTVLFSLILFIPSCAVTVRRLHDAGYSGWIFVLTFVPLIGGLFGIAVFVITLFASEPRRNRWGREPRGEFYHPLKQ